MRYLGPGIKRWEDGKLMDKQLVGWPSAIVGVTLLLVIGAVTVAAIARYPVDDALRVWTALTAIVGVITGAFVSYFFTRGTVQQAQDQTKQAQEQTASVRASAALNETALKRVAGQMDPVQWQSLLQQDDLVRKAFETR